MRLSWACACGPLFPSFTPISTESPPRLVSTYHGRRNSTVSRPFVRSHSYKSKPSKPLRQPSLKTALAHIDHPTANTRVIARYHPRPDTGVFFADDNSDELFLSAPPTSNSTQHSLSTLLSTRRIGSYFLPLAAQNSSLADPSSASNFASRMLCVHPLADPESLPLPFFSEPSEWPLSLPPDDGGVIIPPPDSPVPALLALEFAKRTKNATADNGASSPLHSDLSGGLGSDLDLVATRGTLRAMLLPSLDERRWVVLAQRVGKTVYLRRIRRANIIRVGESGFGWEDACTRSGKRWTQVKSQAAVGASGRTPTSKNTAPFGERETSPRSSVEPTIFSLKEQIVKTVDGPTIRTQYRSVLHLDFAGLSILCDAEVDAVLPPGSSFGGFSRLHNAVFEPHPPPPPTPLTLPHLELKLHGAHILNPSRLRHLWLQCALGGVSHAAIGIRLPSSAQTSQLSRRVSDLVRVPWIVQQGTELGGAINSDEHLGFDFAPPSAHFRILGAGSALLKWVVSTLKTMPDAQAVMLCAERDWEGRDSVVVREAPSMKGWEVVGKDVGSDVVAAVNIGKLTVLYNHQA